jgi:hypothetical protein
MPLIEREEDNKDSKNPKDNQRFPGDNESYREWEEEYYNKHGHVPDYNGEP